MIVVIVVVVVVLKLVMRNYDAVFCVVVMVGEGRHMWFGLV